MSISKNTSSNSDRSAKTGLAALRAYIAEFTKRAQDKHQRSKDKAAHYDIDGVSYESSAGVIIAGSQKSSRGKVLKPTPAKRS